MDSIVFGLMEGETRSNFITRYSLPTIGETKTYEILYSEGEGSGVVPTSILMGVNKGDTFQIKGKTDC